MKRLYPMKFVPIASPRPWGGRKLVDSLGKKFTRTGEDGLEENIPADELIGESWELADMGFEDSVVENGWLAGSTIGDIMDTYFERIVGEKVFGRYGTQFPLLVKFLDIHGKLSVQVHPDDTVAAERYDSLGKTEMWYILDAEPDARIYMGFARDVTAQEFYDACKKGTADRLLNVIHPSKGDVIFIRPGTVHAAEGGILICEIQESSDMTFRLYDWGREFNPATARKMHLEEAFDLIEFKAYDGSDYRPASAAAGKTSSECVADCPFFTVSHITLSDEMRIGAEQFDGFVIYSCIKGEVSLQTADENGKSVECRLRCGDTVLVPAECTDYILSPLQSGSELIESTTNPGEDIDPYTGEPCKDDAGFSFTSETELQTGNIYGDN